MPQLVPFYFMNEIVFTFTIISAEGCGKSFAWIQLSNSGDLLKLLIPSYNWKIISGWTNHSCTVISQKIIEKDMDNRGSKSNFIFKFVKEQRVYDSWHNMCLRCTLTGFERNYQVKILSNQINKRSCTSITTPRVTSSTLTNPWLLTGFTDAEGCFTISICQNKNLRIGWQVNLVFSIGLHKKDAALLEKIKSTFGVGKIYKHRKDSVYYRIETIKELQVIENHFDKYLLRTQKQAGYLLFKMAINLIKNKEHLTMEGLRKILAIRTLMNLGISEKLSFHKKILRLHQFLDLVF